MKKHFILTCMAYFYFGVGVCVEQMGIKVGLGLIPTILVWTTSVLFFVIIVFTSMQKVKDVLFKKDETPPGPQELGCYKRKSGPPEPPADRHIIEGEYPTPTQPTP